MKTSVALIGPRGVGKSRVSRKLAKFTGKTFLSTDMIACYEAGGLSIPDIIKKNNGDWQPFRELEYKILEKIFSNSTDNLVVDCGGGILFDVDSKGNEHLSERKLSLLKTHCKIILLLQPVEFLTEKMKSDPTRPSLSQVKSYEEILKRRIPHYQSAADFKFNIFKIKSEEAAEKIIETLGLRFDPH